MAVICADGCAEEYLSLGFAHGELPHLAALASHGYCGLARGALPSFPNGNNCAMVPGTPPSQPGIGGKYDSLEVEKGKKYFINVGSVGQPRDGDSRAAYVIYDLKAGTIELRRLDYDFEKTQAKILEAGLPERLANRLALGK